MDWINLLKNSPVIPAVRDMTLLPRAIKSGAPVIFLLTGEINTLEDIIRRIHDNGQKAFIHIDLMEGLAADKAGIKFVAHRLKPDGIVTTRNVLIKHAHDWGLSTVQRLFLIDSLAIKNGVTTARQTGTDAVELLPGILPPDFVRQVVEEVRVPVITGGLVKTWDDVARALAGGARGVTTSATELWGQTSRPG